jgi:molybdopterin converting factor small subunit
MVRILFFAQMAVLAGTKTMQWPVAVPQSESDFWEWLLEQNPAVSGMRGVCRLARNGEYLGEGELIAAGDELAVIPPVSGG